MTNIMYDHHSTTAPRKHHDITTAAPGQHHGSTTASPRQHQGSTIRYYDTAPGQDGAIGHHSHRRNRFHVLSHMCLHSLFSLLPASLPQSCAISAICDKATINQKLEIMGNMGG